jgi:sugar phosphate isomerase/epimerase
VNNNIGVVTSFIKLTSFPLEEIFNAVANSGFKYVELLSPLVYRTLDNFLVPNPGPEEIDEEKVEYTANLCEKYGLNIYCVSGHDYFMKSNGVHNLKQAIDLADRFGADFVTTDTGVVKNEHDKRVFFKDIREIAEYAAERGINIAIETMWDWCITGKAAAEILEKIDLPNVGLNYDTGNVIYETAIRPEEDIEHGLKYISFMHLKDQIGGYKVFNFPAIGSGEIDFGKIFALLKEAGYTGPISVELKLDGKDHTIEEIEVGLKESCRYLKECGFRI